MPAATLISVQDELAATLHLVSPDGGITPARSLLRAYWIRLTTSAHRKAERWIRKTLAWAGDEALAIWPPFEDYHLDLALFWCGVKGSEALSDDQRTLLHDLDCRKEIEALTWLNDVTETIAGAAGGAFVWTESGTARNPLLTDPVSVRMGDTPFPSI